MRNVRRLIAGLAAVVLFGVAVPPASAVPSDTGAVSQSRGGGVAAGAGGQSTGDSTPVQAPEGDAPQPQSAVQDVTVHDTLESDTASITGLKVSSIQDGTTPFDGDDARGNDSSATNKRVRSFDRVTYMLDFSITPDSPLDYYRAVRVGFHVTLPVDGQQAGVDTGLYGWADDHKGYEAKVTGNKDGTQTLTVYRLFEPDVEGRTVAPGTYQLPFPVTIKGMIEGDTFTPRFEAFTVPDTGQSTRVATATPDPVTVTSLPSYNIRFGGLGASMNGGARTWDWTADTGNALTSSDGMHNEFGKQKGILTQIKVGIGMRHPDLSKGMRGLEVPKAGTPITFDLHTANTLTKVGQGKVDDVSGVQPYYWGVHSSKGWQGVDDRNPHNQGWHYVDQDTLADPKRYPDNVERSVTNGGIYEVVEERTADETILHVTVTGWSLDLDKLPVLGSNEWIAQCSTTYMDAGCTQMHTAEISVASLFVFTPTTIGGKDVEDYYRSSISIGQTNTTPDLHVTGASGTTPDIQATTTDDRAAASQLVVPNGSFTQRFAYGCTAGNRDSHFNGADCGGWTSLDAGHGTDVGYQGGTIRASSSHRYGTGNTNALAPVMSLTLMKFDDKLLYVTDDLDLRVAGQGSTPNGRYNYVSGGGGDLNVASTPIVQYAVKPDGTGWTSDAEQGAAGFDDLAYYESHDEATEHGTIVGVLIQTRGASPADSDQFHQPTFLLHIKDDAPIGSVAQLTAANATWTRKALASYAGLDVDAADGEWMAWAGSQTPLDVRKHVKTTYEINNGKSYRKAQYGPNGYEGGDTGGALYGDSLYIAAEKPSVGIVTANAKTDGKPGKTLFDLDKSQRYADWQVSPKVEAKSSGSKPTTVTVTVTVPKGLTVIESSHHWGGEYAEQQAGRLPGTVNGGKQVTPTVSADKDGNTVLEYVLEGVVPGETIDPIRFTTLIGDTGDPANDVDNGAQFTVEATVRSTNNNGKPNGKTQTLANYGISVSKTNAQQLATRANPLFVEVDSTLGFTDLLTNPTDQPRENMTAVNVLPKHAVAGTSMHGTLTMGKLTLTGKGMGLDGVKVAYTTDPGVLDMADITTINKGEVRAWPTATVGADGTVILPENTSAFALTIDQMPAGASITGDLTLDAHGNHSGDLYVNRFTDLNNQVIAMSSVVNRSVSGIVSVDADRDGVRSDTDTRVPSIRVTLTALDSTEPITLLNGAKAQAVTDAQGAYQFNAVPAGDWMVRFTPADDNGWLAYDLTVKHADNATDTTNSDADGTHTASGQLNTVSIRLATMPALTSMTASRYVEQHMDVGLVRLAASDGMPFTGSVPWLYVLLGAGVLAMIGASIMLLKRK